MNFSPSIAAPIFCRDAQDVSIVTTSAAPLSIGISCGGNAWSFDLAPVALGDNYVATIRMKELLKSAVEVPAISGASSLDLQTVTVTASNGVEDDITMSFKAAYGGSAGKTPREMLGYWLSWREQISKTYKWSRERLYFLSGLGLTGWASGTWQVSVKVFFVDDTSTEEDVSEGTMSATDCYVGIDCSFSAISALLTLLYAGKTYPDIIAYDISYTLSGFDSSGAAVSIEGYPQRYIISRQDIRAREFVFRNTLGMEDRVLVSGVSDVQLDGDSVSFLHNGIEFESSNNAKEQQEVKSGFLSSPRAVALWLDFLQSDHRFRLDDTLLRQIVVDSYDTDLEDNALGSVSFVYRLSEKPSGRYFAAAKTLEDYAQQNSVGALTGGVEENYTDEELAEQFTIYNVLMKEFNSKLVTLSEAEYAALEATGSVDPDKYYMIYED